MRILIFTFLIFSIQSFGAVPEPARNEYATQFYEAFRLQCAGRSGMAMIALGDAFQRGVKSGESLVKLQAIADLFYWYRRYGNHLKLFSTMPSGDQVIIDEYKGGNCRSHRSKRAHSANRYSEWGNDPQQARMVQNFMFGIGEMIGGIFMIVVLPKTTLFLGGGVALTTHGFYMIKDSLWDLWTRHEMEYFELQQLSERAIQASQ